MLARCRVPLVGRVAAALVAGVLTGALPILDALAVEREHPCRCRHGPEERCGCKACQRAQELARRERARSAERAAAVTSAASPPCPHCHGGPAGSAAAAATSDRAAAAPAPGDGARRPPPVPAGASAAYGCCGTPEQHAALLRVVDPFVSAGATPPGPASPRRSAPESAPSAARNVPRAPPTPPPRAG